MIVVVEGPSAAGKTTWCRRHADRWLAEPGRWPMDEVLRYQEDRWVEAVAADARGELIVLDGDPFKLFHPWASWRQGLETEEAWHEAADAARGAFEAGRLGFADLVLFSDPGEAELRRRRAADATRSRRNFERNTLLRVGFRHWYEEVASFDPLRVLWEHPEGGLTEEQLELGPRPSRSSTERFDRLLDRLAELP